MRRILFQIQGIRIYSYPAMLYVGLICGIVVGNFVARRTGLDSARVYLASLLLLVPALIGARLLFVFTHWNYYRDSPARIWDRSEGGAALYGGVPLMLLCSVPLLAWLNVPLGAFWDVGAFTILVAMGFTRIGCFLNGCCGGRPTEHGWGIHAPDVDGVWARRIPTQLLEAGWAVILLVGAAFYMPRAPFAGAVFLFALVGYSAGRFLFESLRDEQDRVGRYAVHQIISLGLACIAVSVFVLSLF